VEWRDEAKQKNSKLQYTYAKAAAAVKKYPLPLSSGEEAMILDNIGGMIARRLDEAMAKHYARNQQEDVACDELEECSRDMKPIMDSLSVPPPPLDNENVDQAPPKRKKPRKKVVCEYVPTYRSGPYALMLTLYQQSQRINYRGYMTRAELQKEAQPLCDASFTMVMT